ncbi:hypothetical protein [Actinorhabdospora filicis]|uniref:hypothetical protein n=1 Tax=Actinorhabdospora filicis TaxID=1785913 RepID=UPI0025577DAB|nr:hypothetical protein [Actinorhabdospora filicis]
MSLVTAVAFARAGMLGPFVQTAAEEYEAARPDAPPRCWALLLGDIDGDTAHIHRIRFARNVREDSPLVLAEFAETIVPCFGPAYANTRRGYWCDSRDLLAAHREAEEQGMEILGSIHLHPDWHRIGPPHERGQRISEHPTPMDAYLFHRTGWPVNLICFISALGDQPHYALGAWSSPVEEGEAPRGLSVHVPVGV